MAGYDARYPLIPEITLRRLSFIPMLRCSYDIFSEWAEQTTKAFYICFNACHLRSPSVIYMSILHSGWL